MGNSSHTFESVWATLDRIGDKMEQSHAEADRRAAKADKETEALRKFLDQVGKRVDSVAMQLGGMSKNHGLIAEEYFFNSFDSGKKDFFGEKFDEIKKNLKGTETDDEYDIVMLNGHSIGLVEVKHKAHENDLPKILKKPESFRLNFQKYKKHRIYIGLATMAFYPELEQECINQGIAVIKQKGDNVIINEKNLKAF